MLVASDERSERVDGAETYYSGHMESGFGGSNKSWAVTILL